MAYDNSHIKYFALLGQRDSMFLTNVPPQSLVVPMLRYLGKLPQSMIQFIYGLDYYEMVKHHGLQLGYDIDFLYPDCDPSLCQMAISIESPVILLLCTDDAAAIAQYNTLFAGNIGDNVLCLLYESVAHLWTPKCAVADSTEQVFDWLYQYAESHYSIDRERMPFTVHKFNPEFYDMGNVFSPSRINTQILNSMIANWGYEHGFSDEEIVDERIASSTEATSNSDSTHRQDILIEQISKIRFLEGATLKVISQPQFLLDQYRSALVIAMPYTSVDMRKLTPKNNLNEEEKKIAKFAETVLDYYYTPSYISKRANEKKWSREELVEILRIQGEIISLRMNFIDFVGLLHCSFKFSPYLRLPITGSNVNTELSFVGIKGLNRISVAKSKKDTIRKTMEKIGRLLVKNTMAASTVDMLEHSSNQLVVLTDLPIEWAMVNEVPLGFSHDVCRIPETPVTGMLAQYRSIKMCPYTIPRDIMKKTLVVFGNKEPDFVAAQVGIRALQQSLSFAIEECLSKQDFFAAIRRHQPELLIVDCHGGIDADLHQSYLMMGDDKLTGDDIVSEGIRPQLVFLSACNTFPTYNTINSIANAFFEAGSYAVTTSYMQLEVHNATLLYGRLLRNLSEAANQYLHFNWLAFISHLMRTSYIQAPMLEKNTDTPPDQSTMDALIKLTADSMRFGKRREIYSNLNTNSFTKSMGVSYQYIIPHYLMYSTLGRADMIRFQVAVDEVGINVPVER